MANPLFITILASGDIHLSLDRSFVPAGTIAAKFNINSSPRTTKLGTISGTAGAYACSGGNIDVTNADLNMCQRNTAPEIL
jgi:hypothetical protein